MDEERFEAVVADCNAAVWPIGMEVIRAVPSCPLNESVLDDHFRR